MSNLAQLCGNSFGGRLVTTDPADKDFAGKKLEMGPVKCKTDEIAINGVRLGDHIQAKGEKQSEVLFDATELSVSEHYSDAATDDKKDKKKD